MPLPLRIQSVSKRFGARAETLAVDSVSLDIQPGELFFLLGPSGCGKTTLLRMVAGFTLPTSGRILFGDRDVSSLPPDKRNCGMVFQSYALWPHMTVAQNVAFGLKTRKIPKPEREKRVAAALDAVQMREYADRRPAQLSGGQQQRVALARALVIRPDVLLLDEPLSNLDAKLRLEMRTEIRRICREIGVTTLYVTHDQDEALSMADRIALLRRGAVEQVAPPREMYEHPRSRFVAEFLGETNFLPAVVVSATAAETILDTPAGRVRSRRSDNSGSHAGTPGAKVVCSIRPESVRLANGANEHNVLQGKMLETIYRGDSTQHVVQISGGPEFRVLELGGHTPPAGAPARVAFDPADVVILPAD